MVFIKGFQYNNLAKKYVSGIGFKVLQKKSDGYNNLYNF
jgi:hypothetical protein